MTESDDWQRLARHARDRRGDLGLTQEEAAAAGGLSTSTLRLIEGGHQAGYRPATLRDLERALQWERGSVRAILAGGDPVPEPDDPTLPGIAPAPAMVAPAAPDPVATRAGLAVEAEARKIAAEIEREIAEKRRKGTPEDQIFAGDDDHPGDDAEAALWAIPLMPEADRVLRIAALRMMRPPATPHRTNPPIELAG